MLQRCLKEAPESTSSSSGVWHLRSRCKKSHGFREPPSAVNAGGTCQRVSASVIAAAASSVTASDGRYPRPIRAKRFARFARNAPIRAKRPAPPPEKSLLACATLEKELSLSYFRIFRVRRSSGQCQYDSMLTLAECCAAAQFIAAQRHKINTCRKILAEFIFVQVHMGLVVSLTRIQANTVEKLCSEFAKFWGDSFRRENMPHLHSHPREYKKKLLTNC